MDVRLPPDARNGMLDDSSLRPTPL